MPPRHESASLKEIMQFTREDHVTKIQTRNIIRMIINAHARSHIFVISFVQLEALTLKSNPIDRLNNIFRDGFE